MRLHRARRLAGFVVAFGLVILSACSGGQNSADTPADSAGAAPAESAELASLRQFAAGLADTAAARAAGYTDRITPCWFHSANGGQGYHYAKPALIDGNLAVLEPELAMYEPLPDGKLQFLAVEYIVPFKAWAQPEPPTLLGRTFTRNEKLELYVLHVWLGKDNPSGLYADWNPSVSCQHADKSEDRA